MRLRHVLLVVLALALLAFVGTAATHSNWSAADVIAAIGFGLLLFIAAALSVSAQRAPHTAEPEPPGKEQLSLQPESLLSRRSLSLSLLLMLVPFALYYLGAHQATGLATLYYEATFYAYLSWLFFYARRYSAHLFIFATVRWLCESIATFGRTYRTRFFGVLCLCASLATVFEALVGTKLSHYLVRGGP
jgi:hypothetical protein